MLTTQGPIPHQFIGDDRHGGHMLRSLFGNVSGGWGDDELLPIPPKPSQVQPGYRLRGDVMVADGSEAYVDGGGVSVIKAGGMETDMTYWGGRRWMVELDPKACSKCPRCPTAYSCPEFSKELGKCDPSA